MPYAYPQIVESVGGIQGDSIHHVAPASAKGRKMEAAGSGALPGVWPSQMMSKAPSVFPFFSTYPYLPNGL